MAWLNFTESGPSAPAGESFNSKSLSSSKDAATVCGSRISCISFSQRLTSSELQPDTSVRASLKTKLGLLAASARAWQSGHPRVLFRISVISAVLVEFCQMDKGE